MSTTPRLGRRHLLHATAAAAAAASLRPFISAAQTPQPVPLAEATFANREATGEDLVHAWFLLLSATGAETGSLGTSAEQDAAAMAFIQPYLDAAFQLQRANGERYVATTYVPADIDLFAIEGLIETRPTDSLIVARYGVSAPGSSTADTNLVLSDELRPRLTSFRWDDTAAQWKVLTHANFNVPIATICGGEPLVQPPHPAVPTSEEDVTLGLNLMLALRDAILAGNLTPLLDQQTQIQHACGMGITTSAELVPAEYKYRSFEYSDLLVTRNEDVLAISYLGKPDGLVLGFEAVDEWHPRLIAFRRLEEGQWRVIASANFVNVKAVPAGVECVAAG